MGLVPRHLLEDAISEGLMAVLEAHSKNVQPGIVIRRRIIDFMRKETHRRNVQSVHLVSLANVPEPTARDVGQGHIESPKALTPRQLETLDYYSRGFAIRDIAACMGCANGTVAEQLQVVRNKLGVTRTAKGLQVRQKTIIAARNRNLVSSSAMSVPEMVSFIRNSAP